jgi:putative NADH-flavin reductase
MNILVIGTRGIAKEVIKQGLFMGHFIRVLSRHPETLGITDEKLSFIRGDATNPADVNEAAKSMDAVISAIGVPPTNKEVNTFSISTKNIIDAVKTNNIKVFIPVSGIGAGDSKGHGGFMYDRLIFPLLLKKVYEDKDRMEQMLRQSDINWIVVRPGFLTNGPLTQKYRAVTGLAGVKCGNISRADCAHFLLTQAASRTYIKQTPLLTY